MHHIWIRHSTQYSGLLQNFVRIEDIINAEILGTVDVFCLKTNSLFSWGRESGPTNQPLRKRKTKHFIWKDGKILQFKKDKFVLFLNSVGNNFVWVGKGKRLLQPIISVYKNPLQHGN